MQTGLTESTAKLELHLDGSDTIDAFVLSKTISDFAILTQEVANKEDPDAYIRMNVTPFENGSFAIVFSAVCEIKDWIATNPVLAATLAGSIIGSVKGVFEIRKLLKGEKPKSVEPSQNNTVRIENNYGTVITAPAASWSATQEPKVEKLVSNIATYAIQHNPVGGFYLDDGVSKQEYTHEDVVGMTHTTTTIEEKTYRTYTSRAILFVRKPDILGHSAWDFRLEDMKDGKPLSARIEDEHFLDSISEGKELRRGSYIIAMLETRLDLNEQGIEMHGSEKYTVVSVEGGIRNADHEQIELKEITERED